MIELKQITTENMWELFKLKVSKEQENFVGNPMQTLAEAYVEEKEGIPFRPYAIYAGETIIGFIIYCYYKESSTFENNCYHIWRILFDVAHQGKGYGKQAVDKIIEEIKTLPMGEAKSIYMSYEPENKVSKNLFHSFGFVDTNKKFAPDDDEIIAKLELLG